MKKLILLLLCLIPVASAQAEPPSQAPVVVLELFTSQSCSSCPPANDLLAELSTQDHVIALSCHVTYWNHLAWQDTFSQKACTDRQRAYAPYVADGQVFTPQLVINGALSVVGSKSGTVERAIDIGRKEAPVGKIKLTQNQDGSIAFDSSIQKPNVAFIVFEVGAPQDVSVARGENAGSTLKTTNPVINILEIENLNQNTETPTILVALHKNTRKVVIVAQNKENKRIIAAGQINISK